MCGSTTFDFSYKKQINLNAIESLLKTTTTNQSLSKSDRIDQYYPDKWMCLTINTTFTHLIVAFH